jgi:hypothetical protein
MTSVGVRSTCGDLAAGSPAPAAILSQYDSSDEELDDEEDDLNDGLVNKTDDEVADDDGIDEDKE